MTGGRRRDQRQRLLDAPLQLPGSVLTHPFGDDVPVFKVGVHKVGVTTAGATTSSAGRHAGGKMFAILGLSAEPGLLTLKVEPDHGIVLVARHGAITPGYHTNKRHWISVTLDGTVPDDVVRELIEDSYDLVLHTLTARARFEVDPDRFPLPGTHRPGPDA
jgi:predicted DNA-binding protein (MmcQ/YjbR family)